MSIPQPRPGTPGGSHDGAPTEVHDAEITDLLDEDFEGASWVVAIVDSMSGEVESFGPYFRRQAEHLKGWWLAKLWAEERYNVVVMIAPLRFTEPEYLSY